MINTIGKGLRKLSKIPYRLIKYSYWILSRRLVRIPMELVTDDLAFSFHPSGWNIYTSIIADYEKNPEIELRETQMFKFFNKDEVKSAAYTNDLLFLGDEVRGPRDQEYLFYLGTWPWGGMSETESMHGGTPYGIHYDRIENKSTKELWGYGRNPFYDTTDIFPLEFEMNLTIDIYESIKRGYNPLYHNLFPSVVILLKENGQYRAISRDGDHRVAALSMTGTKSFFAEITYVIKEAEADDWYYVRNGFCSKEFALEIFDAYFKLNGRERLEYLSLDK